MLGVEVDLIVRDSLEAFNTYQSVFDVEPIEVGDFILGQNEVVLNINGTRFHLLDENQKFGLVAPKEGDRFPFWFNVMVSDIKSVYEKAGTQGFFVIQPLTEMKEMGSSSAMVKDPFGYVWMLHQVDKVISYEERVKMFEAQGFERRK